MSIEIKQNSNYKKPNIGRVILGAAAGSYVRGLTNKIGNLATAKVLKTRHNNIIKPLTSDEIADIHIGIKKAFNESGLAKKGVEIIFANENNSKEVEDIIRNDSYSSILKYIRTQHSIEKKVARSTAAIVNGKNAQYVNTSKKILIPDGKLQLAFFHEAGHALNANMGSITKILQKARLLGLLAIPIGLIALLKNKKEEGEEPNGFLDKATDFVKNNAGKLTFAAFLPKLTEEGIASLKGNKLAENALSADLAKKIVKSNAFAFAGYATSFLFSAFGIYLATKVRDKIVSGNKEVSAEKIASNDKISDKQSK